LPFGATNFPPTADITPKELILETAADEAREAPNTETQVGLRQHDASLEGQASTPPPFMAPGLPASFIPRPVELDVLIDRVLKADYDHPIGLVGTPGFGKTTLAKSACHNERIKRHFGDGILWVELAKKQNTLGAFNSMYCGFTGEATEFNEWNTPARFLLDTF